MKGTEILSATKAISQKILIRTTVLLGARCLLMDAYMKHWHSAQQEIVTV